MTARRPISVMPELRFPEFGDAPEWSETALHKIASAVSKRSVMGGSERVLSLSGEHGLVLQTDFFSKKVAGDNPERYLTLVRNDFVYNDRATRASKYGTIKRLSSYDSGIVSPIYKCFRFQGDEIPEFWEPYFEAGAHEKQLRRLVNEGARAGRFNISITQFLSTSVWRPDGPEQQKIADCLGSLDDLLGAERRKLEALRQHKQGLVQQLFPRPGETVPRLRFPEFQSTGHWQKEPLSKLCDIKHGYAFEGEFFSDEGRYVVLTPGNFYERGGYRDRGEKQKYYTGDIPRDYVLNRGDLVVAMTEQAAGLLGSPVLVVESDRFLHNQRLGLVTGKIGVAWSNEFFFHVFNTQPVREAIHCSAAGMKVRHTSPTKIGQVVVYFPASASEQQRIADCLSALDCRIAGQTGKLDALKQHRDGLQQRLFPTLEGEAR